MKGTSVGAISDRVVLHPSPAFSLARASVCQAAAASAMEEAAAWMVKHEAAEARLEKAQRKVVAETVKREQLAEALERVCYEAKQDRIRVRTRVVERITSLERVCPGGSLATPYPRL